MEIGKGTVTPLASIFPAEEAQKAVKCVQDTIADQQKELGYLHNFIMDNTNLINLVQRLPDELSNKVMVPFGKAAFFPGRLIHTNEFLVLLGEGYYVERTSKQAIEILQRRGKVLQAQVDSLKAMVEDLKTEASFFDATAVEATTLLMMTRPVDSVMRTCKFSEKTLTFKFSGINQRRKSTLANPPSGKGCPSSRLLSQQAL